MTLIEAINAVESNVTALEAANGSAKAAQDKFDQARTAKETADQVRAATVKAHNDSLDERVRAAQAAKVVLA